MSGFHAGERVWVIYRAIPGQPYVAKLLKIKVASLVDRKVQYTFDELADVVPANRVCRTNEEMQQILEQLNRR